MQEARAMLLWDGQAWLFLTCCVTLEKPLSLFGYLLRKKKNNNNFRCAQSLPPTEPAPQTYIHVSVPGSNSHPIRNPLAWVLVAVVSPQRTCFHGQCGSSMEPGYSHCWPSDYHSRCNQYNTLRSCQQTDGRTRGLLSSRCLLVHLIINNSGKCNNC